jgi:hypothetical protein
MVGTHAFNPTDLNSLRGLITSERNTLQLEGSERGFCSSQRNAFNGAELRLAMRPMRRFLSANGMLFVH